MDAARQQEGRKPSRLTPDKTEEHREKRQPGRLFFGYFLFDCRDAGGSATQEQLPRRRKRKYLAFGCENPINNPSR